MKLFSMCVRKKCGKHVTFTVKCDASKWKEHSNCCSIFWKLYKTQKYVKCSNESGKMKRNRLKVLRLSGIRGRQSSGGRSTRRGSDAAGCTGAGSRSPSGSAVRTGSCTRSPAWNASPRSCAPPLPHVIPLQIRCYCSLIVPTHVMIVLTAVPTPTQLRAEAASSHHCTRA